MASSKPTAATDKKKSRKSSRDASSRSKDKERKSGDKDRKSSSRKKTEAAAGAGAAIQTLPPPAHDPDAIQLFRRYDRSRTGALTRFDFLQLLQDYASGASASRQPLSLTETNGIPIGYERAEKNSEFEAGQLFARYDKDRSGALTMDSFHVFFADFKLQLRAFVEESNYRGVVAAPAPASPRSIKEGPVRNSVTFQDVASGNGEIPVNGTALRAQYRSALWKLRKICKEELLEQREHIVQQMKYLRDEMASRQRNRSKTSRWADSKHHRRRPRTDPFATFGNDLSSDDEVEVDSDSAAKSYEALEDDLDKVDEIVRFVRRFLHKGSMNVSLLEMQKFVDQAGDIQEEALSLAMKEYNEIERPPKSMQTEVSDPISPPTSSTSPAQPSSQPSSAHTDLEGLLRIKDQMIYQLLQERTAMRKERSAIEVSLKKLSEVSTREMKKWARLTDDMQAEIEQLRSQLQSQQTQ